ncbi:MAG: cyclic nucleotide-binding domain-containing protein [Gammaproteobacteria bacterium]|nr:cyclic nucleotide-binding domain-containing protein [Gammaproteobacteria bacterium]
MTNSLSKPLKETGLFDALTPREFDTLITLVDRVDLPTNVTFIHEGEVGEEMYIILSGAVQVFTLLTNNQEIALRRLEQGAYVGEQALLPDGEKYRNASVRTICDTTLIKIQKADFQDALAANSPLKTHLMEIGSQQIRENLSKQSTLFRTLSSETDIEAYSTEVTFQPGETIFSQGQTGDTFYFILSGTAVIHHEDDTGQIITSELHKGLCFGELAIIRDAPRAATAIAKDRLRVLTISAVYFKEIYENSPLFRGFAETLRKIYLLPQRWTVTQFTGKFMGMDCITVLHRTDSGLSITSSRVIGQDIFNMSVMGIDAQSEAILNYQNPDMGIDRQLMITDNRIVGFTAIGAWEELGKIYRTVVDGEAIDSSQINRFQKSGTLFIEMGELVYGDSEIICQCLKVPRSALHQAIQQGCHSFDALVETTGASSVCGGCRHLVQKMVGQAEWVPAMVSEITSVTKDTSSFRLISNHRKLKPAKPGQHVVIQAQIKGRWFERPYTLTSASGETDYYEITIKREPKGFFSNWMIDHCSSDTLIQLSDPQGETYLDSTESRPVVCLVAGIGMTPALAMCRSVIQDKHDQELHIHYSVTSRDHIVRVDELRDADAQHTNINLNLHVTDESGRLTGESIDSITQEVPDALFYLCGPDSYLRSMQTHLKEAGVLMNRVRTETFTQTRFRSDSASRTDSIPRMPYRDFVEKVLKKEIKIPKVSQIAAHLKSEKPELLEVNGKRMALTTFWAVLRAVTTSAAMIWAMSQAYYLLLLPLVILQGVNYFCLIAIIHDLVVEV